MISRTTSFTAGLAISFVAFASIVWGEPQAEACLALRCIGPTSGLFDGGARRVAIASEAPDDSVTPGVVASTDQREVCETVGGLTYSKRHRATPYHLKEEIRERDQCDPHNSEVDHRLPLALGGDDVEGNLSCQPGPASGVKWSYHDKDRLEVYAWESVCKHHTMTLGAAQAMFLAPSNWIKRYCEVFTDARCKQ